MEFVEVFSQPPFWPFVVAFLMGFITVIFCTVGASVTGVKKKRSFLHISLFTGSILGVIFLIAGIWGLINAMTNEQDDSNERRELIAQEIKNTYDLTIEPYEISRNSYSSYNGETLTYPAMKPTNDFAVFGTINVKSLDADDKLVANDVTLVWTDGEMRLYGLDENNEIGSELPRVEQE